MTKIPLPTIGEILQEEFIIPLGISPVALSKKTTISLEQIDHILHNKLVINADISQQIGQVFRVSDNYFLKLQKDINERK
ncbi:HigA family addiction module antitoxin [Limosilactobacillus reuteri]|uniref:HigA family addiction module antitoxin n=1 Tax=Limosilactobacillus reuteri TaxID=1598 RepID=UPI001E5EA850|nr:HigA family addiction module antitoxin [Limosilactobacillus reuteri]MCC4436137.1 HigA family addiction module antitoxin [Limosilactobacillus reuteri]MCC4438080.1 HigA family addiction module antitoxin [Limosilactobacillus reuteri]MCC4441876.1 HigA family addiction module antitoxin [Limosilactobacillus reuteri]MCC4443887.1 HigA family addiction module antitoxin [Limosilactobacillus reuteri]MCC4445673.1 HigA family addiction module antitoxin [Limosilactobacillus reuteri]